MDAARELDFRQGAQQQQKSLRMGQMIRLYR